MINDDDVMYSPDLYVLQIVKNTCSKKSRDLKDYKFDKSGKL